MYWTEASPSPGDVPSSSCAVQAHRLLAFRTAAPTGTIAQLADDLSTPAVLGQGLTFVDVQEQLRASTTDRVRAALAAAVR